MQSKGVTSDVDDFVFRLLFFKLALQQRETVYQICTLL
jgi:hypothetical protein